MMIVLYEFMRQPPYWIARDEEGYWLVPARTNGWHDRTPFVGRVGALREVRDTQGIDLGVDVRTGPKGDQGTEPGK